MMCDLFFGSINLFTVPTSDPLFATILYDIRLPKTITSIMAGSGLALSGLLMQSLFRNPLAGPYVLGISSGSSLFVAIATMLVSSAQFSPIYMVGKSIISLFSVIGALFVTFTILLISRKNKSNVILLLIGLMFGQILGALQGFIEYISNPNDLKTFVIWGMGQVGNTTRDDLWLMIPICVTTVAASFFFVKSLNAILLNEQYAQNLGINIQRLKMAIIIITAILVGIITAFCGPIAFIGMSTPIATRLLFKTSHHLHQMTFCILIGACVMVTADLICQLLSSSIMLPINTITTLIGSPIVLYLLFKSKINMI